MGPLEAPTRFSLTRGGPLYALLRAARVFREGSGDARRASLVCAAVTWLPLVLLAGVETMAGGAPRTFQDLSAHARFLAGIPLFFAAEEAVEGRCARAVDRFATSTMAPVASPALHKILARAGCLRDSLAAELVMLAAAYLSGGLWTVWEPMRPAAGGTAVPELSRLWYVVVALPMFRFLLFRWLWRWAIWSFVLVSLSRLPVRAIALHPDGSAGLRFLSRPSDAFVLVLAAVSLVLSSAWTSRVLAGEAEPASFVAPFGVFALIAAALSLGPLLTFSRHVFVARRDGLEEYDALALRYVRLFHRQWIERGAGDAILGSPDIQSLADLANGYDVVERTRSLAFGARSLAILVAALGVPMLPLVATAMPLPELLVKLGTALIGTPAP